MSERPSLPHRNNRIEGVVVTYNDVTELKRAEGAVPRTGRFHPQPCVVGKQRRLRHLVQPALV